MVDGEPCDLPEPVPAEIEDARADSLPSARAAELPPLAASQIPSAEFQFGVAGRAEHVRALVAEGRLRRLPTVANVEPQFAERASEAGEMFQPPLAPRDDDAIRTARGASSSSVLR
jgi:hypothetical protein